MYNNINGKITKRIEASIFFFLFAFMELCFIATTSDEELNVISNTVYVFHISTKITYIFALICSIFMVSYLFKKMYIDNITFALILSASLGIIPLMYASNTNNYWGNYFVLIVSLVSYFICSNSKYDFKDYVYKILCLVCLVISLQVIFTEYKIFSAISISNITNITVKAFLKIPIGGSNKIAAYLLPIVLFIITYKRNKWAFIISFIAFYALVLCRSKNVILIVFIYSIWNLLKKMYSFIINDKSVSQFTKIIILSIITLILGFVFKFTIGLVISIISSLQFTSYVSPYSNPIVKSLDEISSGRVVVYMNELSRFTDHMLLGNGFGYDIGYARSHNWIIEVLAQRGVIGTLIYLFCIYNVMIATRKYHNDRFIKSSIILLVIVFIQGLAEITVFTIGIDFLIWSISGFTVSRVNYLRKNKS